MYWCNNACYRHTHSNGACLKTVTVGLCEEEKPACIAYYAQLNYCVRPYIWLCLGPMQNKHEACLQTVY